MTIKYKFTSLSGLEMFAYLWWNCRYLVIVSIEKFTVKQSDDHFPVKFLELVVEDVECVYKWETSQHQRQFNKLIVTEIHKLQV